ncbi:MAG: chemotaxis protein CheA [Ruminiclostridium sp.]|nr:chemotaxis protein CheA [Ruminiclostridium sp.]
MAKVEAGMESMLEVYIFETNTLLEQLDEILLRTEEAGVFAEDDINEIFRIMHTIKGSSAMMGFENLQKLAHKGEDMFFIIREKPEIAKSAPFVYELIFEVSDLYKAEIEYIQTSDDDDFSPTDFSENYTKLMDATAKLKAMAAGEAVPEDTASAAKDAAPAKAAPIVGGGEGTMTVRVFFEEGCGMENLRAFLLLTKIKEEGEIISHIPADVETNAEAAKGIVDNGFIITFRGFDGNNDAVVKAIETALNVASYEIVETVSEEEAKKEEQTKAAESGAPAQKSAAKSQDDAKKSSGGGQKQSLISVNLAKLDQLHDIVGEIITTESMVIANPDLEGLRLESFSKAARQLRKLTDELQDVVMSIRMVPLAGVFQKMGRIVRDMKMKLNKDAELILEGETTEVDKSIVDSLNDPLMHLVRNCMDHGIETDVNERIAAGKPAKATVKLAAKHSSNEVIITVSDDGKGINCQKVLAKAIKNGMLTKPESEYTNKEIQNMILLPGFSTNEQVTEYSGRGVGMDVVKSNIEQIGGTLAVDSEEGKGTNFIIKIPLTLAIVEGMKLKVGSTIFTVPISSIKESLMVGNNKLINDTQQGEMIMIRGICYPILRLHEKFKMPTEVTDLNEGILLLVEVDDKSVCLFADRLIGEQPVVVKPFPKYLSQYNIKAEGLSGCTVMGDGTISLIIDVNSLINS